MDIQVPGTNRMIFRLGNRTQVHKASSFWLKALDTDSIVLTNEFTAGVAFRFRWSDHANVLTASGGFPLCQQASVPFIGRCCFSSISSDELG